MKISELFENNNQADYGMGYDDCFQGHRPSGMFDSQEYKKGYDDCKKAGEYAKGEIASNYSRSEKKQGGFIELDGEEFAEQPLGYMEVNFNYTGEYSEDEYSHSTVEVLISDGDENLILEDSMYSEDFDKFLEDLYQQYGIKGYWNKRMDFGTKQEPIPFTNKLNDFFKEYESYSNNGQ